MNARARHIALVFIALRIRHLRHRRAQGCRPARRPEATTTTSSASISAEATRTGRPSKRRSASRATAPATSLGSRSSRRRKARHAPDRSRRHRDRRRARQRHDGGHAGDRTAPPRRRSRPATRCAVRIGNWPTGFYFARLDGPRRKGRVRAVRAAAARPRRAPHRGRLADADVAGVQLPRRRRRRQAGHVVRRPGAACGAPRAAVREPRHSAATTAGTRSRSFAG